MTPEFENHVDKMRTLIEIGKTGRGTGFKLRYQKLIFKSEISLSNTNKYIEFLVRYLTQKSRDQFWA